MIVSRSIGLFGFIVLIVSLVFPWFMVNVGSYSDSFSLYDVRVVHDVTSSLCSYFSVGCGVDYGLQGWLPIVILVMFIVSWLAFLVPELNISSGFLGLLWSGLIYNDPGRLLIGSHSWLVSKFISLRVGFYLFLAASIILLVSGVAGLYERFKGRKRWY